MKKIFLPVILIAAIATASAQNNLNQEVQVVKPYEPVINDAFKVSELPKIVDTFKVVPQFEYDAETSMYPTKYSPKPIKPAKLIAEPLPLLHNVYIKGGFGSYITPMLNVFVGTQRNEKWILSASSRYNSSNAKIKNEDKNKVYAGISHFDLDAQARYLSSTRKAATVYGRYGNQQNYYYGYNQDLNLPDSLIPKKRKEVEKQTVNYYAGGATLETNNLDSSLLSYKLGLGVDGMKALHGIGQDNLRATAFLSYLFENEFLGVDIDIDYHKTHGITDSLNSMVVNFNPWVGAYGRKWRVAIGVNTIFDQEESGYKFYPDIQAQYNIIDYFLMPYVELNGNYKVNTFQDIYMENPFVQTNMRVKPTDTRLNLVVGFRGNVSSKVAFNIKGELTNVSNQYFYVNDTSLLLQNKFVVVYDDMTRTKIMGELSYKTSDKFKIGMKASYMTYSLDNEEKAWHMPNVDVSLDASYNLGDKIIATTNIYYLGKRYAKTFDDAGLTVAKELGNIVDLNLGLEYRVSKRLSAFVDLKNLCGSRYYKWNNYQSHRFNLMAGLTFAF